MKLRIHHQEIRFRLSPRDLTYLEANESLEEHLHLSPQAKWTYALRLTSSEMSHLIMSDAGQTLTLELPQTAFREWLQCTEIEWTFSQAQPTLSILVEKDLKPNRS